MRGVASLTGSISPTMVANIVIESMIATPEMGREGIQEFWLWEGLKRFGLMGIKCFPSMSTFSSAISRAVGYLPHAINPCTMSFGRRASSQKQFAALHGP